MVSPPKFSLVEEGLDLGASTFWLSNSQRYYSKLRGNPLRFLDYLVMVVVIKKKALNIPSVIIRDGV